MIVDVKPGRRLPAEITHQFNSVEEYDAWIVDAPPNQKLHLRDAILIKGPKSSLKKKNSDVIFSGSYDQYYRAVFRGELVQNPNEPKIVRFTTGV